MAGLATGNGFPSVVVTGGAMTTSRGDRRRKAPGRHCWTAKRDSQTGGPFVEQYDLPVRIGGHCSRTSTVS